MQSEQLEQLKRRAVEEISARFPKASAVRASDARSLAGGTLVEVEFEDIMDKKKGEVSSNYLWFDGRGQYQVAETDEDVVRILKNVPAETPLERLLDPEIIPGYIAIAITACIIFLVIARTDQSIPKVLEGSLAVILGFYFGRRTSKT